MKNIMKTQSTFTIYHEGQPDFWANVGLKVDRFLLTKGLSAWDKTNYYFANHTMEGYQEPVEARPTRNAHGRFISQS